MPAVSLWGPSSSSSFPRPLLSRQKPGVLPAGRAAPAGLAVPLPHTTPQRAASGPIPLGKLLQAAPAAPRPSPPAAPRRLSPAGGGDGGCSPGSREIYLSTTTMGLSLPVTTISPFQIMRADETIMPKFSTW